MFKRWKLLLAILAGLLGSVFCAAMFDTFFRQLVFGPRYNGIPLQTWQRFFRAWDTEQKPPPPTLLDSVHESVVNAPGPNQWKQLSGTDRLAILLTLADDPQEIVRLHVAGHLGNVPGTTEVVALLRRYTKEGTGRVRQYAARSLGEVEPPALEAIPELFKVLTDHDPFAAEAARRALGKLGSREPGSVVPKLIPLIESTVLTTQLSAMDVLSYVKAGTEPAIPALLKVLHDSAPPVRAAALGTLGMLKATAAVPQIIAAMNDPDRAVCQSAIYAIGNFGPDAWVRALPALIDQVKSLHLDPGPHHVDPPVLIVLGKIGGTAHTAIAELLKLRNHQSQTVRLAAERTLSQIDPVRYPFKAEPK